MVNKALGKKPTDEDSYNQWMTKLGHIADELHHLYMAPLLAVTKKFVKDEEMAKKIANGVFHAIVATFLIASGATAVKALQSKNLSLATLESALSAIKGGELKDFFTGLFKS
jgi:Flp pilus assembly pilin Flp